MAYFDSTKNRALWEIRLAELKKERAAREAGGGAGAGLTQNQPQVKTANPTRVRVSYQQLLQEEAKALAKATHSLLLGFFTGRKIFVPA